MSLTAAQAFQSIETRIETYVKGTVVPAAEGELAAVESSQQLATLKAGLLADLRSAESEAMAEAAKAAAGIMSRIGATQVPAPMKPTTPSPVPATS